MCLFFFSFLRGKNHAQQIYTPVYKARIEMSPWPRDYLNTVGELRPPRVSWTTTVLYSDAWWSSGDRNYLFRP